MKIKRQKQARSSLNTYKHIFGFHEPYLILADGTFCQAALKAKIQIKDHLTKYLNTAIRCCTTRCVLAELDLLGDAMYGAKMIAQRFQLRACSHRATPVPAAECLKSLFEDKNSGRYFIATQDMALTKLARTIPGVPVLYVFQSHIVLDKPSKATEKHINHISKEKSVTSKVEKKSIKELKKDANIIHGERTVKPGRKRKAKGPNPLSCKKKKTGDKVKAG
uniref:rRNA-processing protein UTP23 homolog n=1 Tax=Ciona savignyi TaxID=51511 RepID=H2YJH8_CIOSA